MAIFANQRLLLKEGIYAAHTGKWLAYNYSPSFNWSGPFKSHELTRSQEALADLDYKFQPLDGMTNYTHGYPMVAISIALYYQMKSLSKRQAEQLPPTIPHSSTFISARSLPPTATSTKQSRRNS